MSRPKDSIYNVYLLFGGVERAEIVWLGWGSVFVLFCLFVWLVFVVGGGGGFVLVLFCQKLYLQCLPFDFHGQTNSVICR